MTLNDNPRVIAERRLRTNYQRLGRLNDRYRKWVVEHENGVAARMYWTGVTDKDRDRAAAVRKLIFAQIRADEKFLKSFR